MVKSDARSESRIKLESVSTTPSPPLLAWSDVCFDICMRSLIIAALFGAVLAPAFVRGQSRPSLREDELSIPVKSASSLLDNEQDLGIRVDPRPDERRHGEALQRRWAGGGSLWLEPIAFSSVRLHVERSPSIESCRPRCIF